MIAHIWYEDGTSPEFVEAASLAYTAVGQAANHQVSIMPKPLDFDLPTLGGGQVDSAFIEKIRADSGVNLLILAKRDLGAAGLNFCFGRSRFNGGASIVSSSRVTPTTLVGLAVHEIGHSVGLVPDDSPRLDRITSFEGHCINDCVMMPVNNIREMDEATQKIIRSPQLAGFCVDCALHIDRQL